MFQKQVGNRIHQALHRGQRQAVADVVINVPEKQIYQLGILQSTKKF
jgi:hypothetical protein